MKQILIYFGMDKRSSPFDILFAYDVGFDIVLSYSEVQEEEITPLVQDAMFPRGPKGAQHTTLLFGGADLTAVEKMALKARKTMFPPFQLSVTLDPKGSYTTASALVAKVMEALAGRKEKFEGQKAVVFGGSGPVGRVASRLLIKKGVDVIITSRKYQGKEPFHYIIEAVEKIEEKEAAGRRGEVTGVRVSSSEELLKSARDCQIVISAAPAGVEMLPQGYLSRLDKCLVAADVNAVPPAGLGDIKPDYDKKEVGKILTIGALTIGNLRNKIAAKMLQEAREGAGVWLDYTHAFSMAREFLGL